MNELRSLTVRSYGKLLDAEAIGSLEKLALLRLTAKSLENRAALGSLPALVDLTFYSGSLDIEAIAKIRTLRRLPSPAPASRISPLWGRTPPSERSGSRWPPSRSCPQSRFLSSGAST